MRLKCLSFDRKLCQNVVFVVGDIFLHACVGAPHLLAMLWFKSHQVKAPLWVFMAWSLPLALLGAAQARGWWLQSSLSASSALIMKPHSIRGPSSLCDCRNYHLPNWCEVPRACPAPPARTIRQPRQRDAHEELLAPIVLKQRGNIARQGHFPMERALVASPYNFQWSVTCAQHLSHVPAPILSLLGTAVFGDRCQWGDDFCRTREKDGERLNLLGSTQWKQAWHLALRSLY